MSVTPRLASQKIEQTFRPVTVARNRTVKLPKRFKRPKVIMKSKTLKVKRSAKVRVTSQGHVPASSITTGKRKFKRPRGIVIKAVQPRPEVLIDQSALLSSCSQ